MIKELIMQRIAEFEIVEGLDFTPELPVRATAGSAGYDIKTPVDIVLTPGKSVRIATGLRCRIAEGWVLLIMPKSGLGFKYRLQLDNTVGVIDSDYYYADNQGHILIQITNDSNTEKTLEIPAGKAFAQGIFVPFGITESDAAEGERHGGFGSTDA
jgi:dUTP pyrophosphatase